MWPCFNFFLLLHTHIRFTCFIFHVCMYIYVQPVVVFKNLSNHNVYTPSIHIYITMVQWLISYKVFSFIPFFKKRSIPVCLSVCLSNQTKCDLINCTDVTRSFAPYRFVCLWIKMRNQLLWRHAFSVCLSESKCDLVSHSIPSTLSVSVCLSVV